MKRQTRNSGSLHAQARPRSLGRRGVGRLLGKPIVTALREREPSAGYYLILGREAMACMFQVFLRPEDRTFVPVVHEALNEIDHLEDQMTIYRDESELSRLNRSAFLAPVRVEKRLYLLLREASRIGEETRGAFDITSGPLIRCWGFFDRKARKPPAEDLEAAMGRVGWGNLVFYDEECAVGFRVPGVELNLGSIGKGYALDRAARRLRRSGLRNFMIHAGHSSILASGRSNSGAGWEVGIRDPLRPGRTLGSIRLVDQGMSTSGSGQQFFESEGRRYGHVIDPRTGSPCLGEVFCSVVAPSAATADALSTAFLLLPPQEIQNYCDSHLEVGTIRVIPGNEGCPADLRTWGLPQLRTEESN